MGDPSTVAAARKGGRASAEAARRRKREGWEHAFQRIVDEDPEAFARKLLASANGAALVKAAELAAELRKSPFREREEELEEREAALQRRTDSTLAD